MLICFLFILPQLKGNLDSETSVLVLLEWDGAVMDDYDLLAMTLTGRHIPTPYCDDDWFLCKVLVIHTIYTYIQRKEMEIEREVEMDDRRL